MRVGIDASNLRVGGGVTHLYELLRACNPERDTFSKVVVWGGESTLSKLPTGNQWLRLVHVPALDATLPERLWWRRTRLSALADRDCDLLFFPGGLGGYTRKPWVTMSRNMLPFEVDEKRRYGLSLRRFRFEALKYAQTKSFIRANGLIFLTEYAKNAVLKALPRLPRQITVIPHGVDQRFVLAPRSVRRIEDCSIHNPLRLIYVSTVDLYKHQWHVVEAVAGLRHRGIPVVLDLIGSAAKLSLARLRKALERFDPNGEFVSYCGSVSFEDLHKRYHAADVFVYASSCENMPNILLEAMAAGLPIASSNRGPMPEVLDGAGVYFNPEDPSDIMQVLEQLVHDSQRRRELASAAFKRAQNYSWHGCAKSTFEFLCEVYNSSTRCM